MVFSQQLELGKCLTLPIASHFTELKKLCEMEENVLKVGEV